MKPLPVLCTFQHHETRKQDATHSKDQAVRSSSSDRARELSTKPVASGSEELNDASGLNTLESRPGITHLCRSLTHVG